MRLTTAKIVAGVFLVGLAVRLAVLFCELPRLNPDVDLDSYRSLARNLAAGRGFVAPARDQQDRPSVARTPGYPLFLAALIKLGGDRIGLFLLVQCVLGAIIGAFTVM